MESLTVWLNPPSAVILSQVNGTEIRLRATTFSIFWFFKFPPQMCVNPHTIYETRQYIQSFSTVRARDDRAMRMWDLHVFRLMCSVDMAFCMVSHILCVVCLRTFLAWSSHGYPVPFLSPIHTFCFSFTSTLSLTISVCLWLPFHAHSSARMSNDWKAFAAHKYSRVSLTLTEAHRSTTEFYVTVGYHHVKCSSVQFKWKIVF